MAHHRLTNCTTQKLAAATNSGWRSIDSTYRQFRCIRIRTATKSGIPAISTKLTGQVAKKHQKCAHNRVGRRPHTPSQGSVSKTRPVFSRLIQPPEIAHFTQPPPLEGCPTTDAALPGIWMGGLSGVLGVDSGVSKE